MDGFQWPNRHLSTASTKLATADCSNVDLLKMWLARLDDHTFSTSFSGIDAPGTATLSLKVFAASMLGEQAPVRKQSHLFAIECLRPAQEHLLVHPHPAVCVFDDITQFLSDVITECIPSLVDSGRLITVLGNVLKQDNSMKSLGT
jgi:hypothetical protein